MMPGESQAIGHGRTLSVSKTDCVHSRGPAIRENPDIPPDAEAYVTLASGVSPDRRACLLLKRCAEGREPK